MENLIVVNHDKQTVSARELWEFLDKPHGEFSKWFNRHLDFGFVENVDFAVFDNSVDDATSFGGKRKLTDYQITIDMAKELSMLQRTEKGKEARKYFIEVEKKWKEQTPKYNIPKTFSEALRLAADLEEEKKLLEEKIEEQKPKVIFADAVSASEKDILVRELAKLLNQNGIDIGEKRLYQWLRLNEYIEKFRNFPTQKSSNMKLFRTKETAITHSDGNITVNFTTKVTPKGQQYFINKFLKGEN